MTLDSDLGFKFALYTTAAKYNIKWIQQDMILFRRAYILILNYMIVNI